MVRWCVFERARMCVCRARDMLYIVYLAIECVRRYTSIDDKINWKSLTNSLNVIIALPLIHTHTHTRERLLATLTAFYVGPWFTAHACFIFICALDYFFFSFSEGLCCHRVHVPICCFCVTERPIFDGRAPSIRIFFSMWRCSLSWGWVSECVWEKERENKK